MLYCTPITNLPRKKIGNNSFNNIKIPSNKFNQGDERLLQWKEIREDTSV